MRKPRLKNYFVAVSADLYQEFESSRLLPITGVSIDIVTNTVQGRDHWVLAAQPALADEIIRQSYRWGGVVYVLRIPAVCIDRSRLEVTPHPQLWRYAHSIEVPECAVYLYPGGTAPA